MLKQALGALAALLVTVVSASAQGLVPAERFIDPVSAYGATLSPDGNYIAYIARTNTEQRIVVVDLVSQAARAIQVIGNRGANINTVDWKGSDRLVSVISFHQGVSNRYSTGILVQGTDYSYDIVRVVSMNRDGGGLVQMFEGQTTRLIYGYGSTLLLSTMPSDPTHILIAAQDRNGFGVYTADVRTGAAQRVADGDDKTIYYEVDGNGATVIREDYIMDGSGYRMYRRAPDAHDWTFVTEIRRAGTLTNSPDFDVIGAGPGAAQVYVLARRDNADRASIYLYNTATGEFGEPIATGANSDTLSAWLSRGSHQVVATCEFAQRLNCQARDPAMQRQLNAVDAFFSHQATINLVDMSDDGQKWLLMVDGPTNPGAYYLYGTATHRVTPVATLYPNLSVDSLSPTQVVNYQSRDGTPLWAYVTAQTGVSGPRPMVVMPHGGPEARDTFRYDAFTEFLSSRGYVVLQPNFRGGSGFGRAFADAGRGQWGLRMQDDVTDAVRHMIETGVADPHRICIVGASYGGYAALEGVSSTPDLYRCAISIAGVADLQLSLNREGPHWGLNYQYWLHSIGSDAAAIAEHSPRLHASRITAPVLLIHGEEDTIVPFRQSELMQQALNSAGHQTRLVRVTDEGHIWDSWSNEHRLILLHETEQFLAQNLGPAQ